MKFLSGRNTGCSDYWVIENMTPEHSSPPSMTGYRIGYAKGKGEFRVYICMVLSAIFVTAWIFSKSEILLVLAIFFGGASYYFYPLIETGKMRLGAGEHGIFIEGLGIIPWRAIKSISQSMYSIRTIDINELNIKLAGPLPKMLVADWRSMPRYRLLMKLPWSMTRDNTVRIKLEPFESTPDEIVAALTRNWRYFEASY